MPSVHAKRFQQLFQQALAHGARLSQEDVQSLQETAARLRDPREKGAADTLLKLVKDDHSYDVPEQGAVVQAMARLLGRAAHRLPKDLARLLEHAAPLPNVRVKHYDLGFDLSGLKKNTTSFPAQAVIQLEQPAPATAILEVDAERLHIESVLVGGKPVPFSLRDGRIFVEAEGARTLDVRYSVTPTTDRHGYGLIHDKYNGRLWTLTWPYGTGALFPSASHPSDGATATVSVKAAAGMDVVGAGRKQRDGKFHLDHDVPATAVAFYAGAFTDGGKTRRAGVDVVTQGFGKRMTLEARAESRQAVADALQFFGRWFGPYRFGDRLNIVEVDHDYGGMEHAGAIAVTVGNAADFLEAAVHETAHHWFGDGVRIEQRGEYWMSEGFTQYATFRAFEARKGQSELYRLLDDARERVGTQLDERPVQLVSTDPASAYDDFFTDLAYYQGPWMLRMLEVRFGRERFDPLLRDWVLQHTGKAVTTADFVAFVKKATGEDLTSFFASWNSLVALPDFRDESTIRGDVFKVHLINRNQTRKNHDVPLPEGLRIPVVVKGEGDAQMTFMVDPRTRPELKAPFPIKSVEWDPERTVLASVW